MKKLLLVLCIAFSGYSANAQFTIFQEDFDNVSLMLTSGWSINNLSNPVGSGTWQQEDGTLGLPAYNGAATSCAMANFNSVNLQGTISNWLISPQISLRDGDTVSFYTISYNSRSFPDRLECRLNELGTTNVGSNETSIGDFTDIIVSVNPNLDTASYPSIQVAGQTWTKFEGVVSGLPGGHAYGRIAFRYFVTNGGLNGTNGTTIGLDAVRVRSSVNSVGIENTLDVNIAVFPNPATDIININFGKPMNAVLSFTDMQGKTLLSQPVTSDKTSIDVSTMSAGNYIIQVIDQESKKHFSQTIVVQ